jgi:MFS family permease
MDDTKELKKIELEEDSLRDIDTTRKWAMVIAIFGFIAIGLMLILGIVTGLFLSVFNGGSIAGAARWGFLPGAIMIVFCIIYFFPILYLYRFSKHAGIAVRNTDKNLMQKAIRYLRKYFVYIGILLIIVLVVYFVAFIVSGASLAFLKDMGTGV